MSVKEMTAIVNAEGQITLPEEIRQALELGEGDEVVLALGGFEVKWVSLRAKRIDGLQPLDLHEARRAFMEDVAENAMREGLSGTQP